MLLPVECPICESPKARSLFKLKGLDLLECDHCSMVYVPSPAPEVVSIYKDSYFNNDPNGRGYHNYRSEFGNHLLSFTKRLEEAEKLLTRTGRVLDVGCALGHFGEAARRRGWDVYVTDVSEYAVHEASENYNLNGFILGMDRLPVKHGIFDLVTMYDVIEHLSHPLDLLRSVRKSLAPHGYLHLTTPDISSLSGRLMGRHWYHIKPDEHLLYFTRDTLRTTLERAGFEVLKMKPVTSTMRINDVLQRLERYSKPLVSALRWFCRFIGISNKRIRLLTGEMQAWARPAGPQPKDSQPTEQVKDILDIVCCPNCRSQIQIFEDVEALCTQCELSFGVNKGIINFSKYEKRSKRKLIGSS